MNLSLWADRLEHICRRIFLIGSWVIIPLILITVFDVITRKFVFMKIAIADSIVGDILSPTKLQEMEWHLHTVLFFFALGYAYIKNSHVRVDVYRETLSPTRRMRLELWGLMLAAIPYTTLVLYFAAIYAYSSFMIGESSAAMTGIPYRWIIKSMAVVGLLSLFLACWSMVLRLLVTLYPSHKYPNTGLDKVNQLINHQEVADQPFAENEVETNTLEVKKND